MADEQEAADSTINGSWDHRGIQPGWPGAGDLGGGGVGPISVPKEPKLPHQVPPGAVPPDSVPRPRDPQPADEELE